MLTGPSRRERIAQLSPTQRALLEHWVLARIKSRDATRRQTPPAERLAPLSFAQERLCFLDRLVPGTPLYNMYSALEFRSAIDIDAIQATLDEVCRRQEALRTTIRSDSGAPVLVIAPPRSRPLDIVDLRALDPTARATEALRVRKEEASRPFDLASGPLFRTCLVRLEDSHALLLITIHHIVSDGWSMDVLHQEIQTLYDAFCHGRPSPLPELPVQYADFVRWQRRTLVGDKLDELLRYWRDQLAGVAPLIPLPIDRERPPMQSFEGETITFTMPAADRDALAALGQQEGVTLFMTLLSAFAAVLGWYADTDDVVVGCPIANRTRAELEGLVGFFVNTLALRVRLDSDPTFRQLLARAKETTLGAYAHQDMPFERLVEDLHPVRTLAHNPLVQVMFALQNTPASRVISEGSRAESNGSDNVESDDDAEPVAGVAKFDLTLSFAESEHGLVGAVEYAAALFDAARMRRLMGHLSVFLRNACARPHARLSQLRMMADDETNAWRAALTGPRTSFPSDRGAHELLEDMAYRCPDAPAIESSGQVVTYRDLNAAANRLARRLQAEGVGPEVPVALALPRGLDAVTSLFAILKAGGAFVPLDPALPAARQAHIVAGAALKYAVAYDNNAVDHNDAASRSTLKTLGLRVIDPRAAAQAQATRDGDSNLDPVDAGTLAYIMHTSGSTGTPKGVLIEHRGLWNMVEAQARWFGDDGAAEAGAASAGERGVRMLQFASLSFDASVFEILHIVRLGGCLVIPSTDVVLAGDELGRALATHDIDLVLLPASILAGVPQRELPKLRTIILGGETCTADLVERWAHGRTIFNAYGPTEVTIWVTATECEADGRTPPIGRVMPNAAVRLLDRALRPTPIGVNGEIYVTSIGLARGYVSRPAATAERFIPDPYSDTPGARMYRTGDLARLREDGQLVFVGRADDQVKVRGFRIEPGEIEATLRQHPAVATSAVAVASGSGPWHETLVAFWTPLPDAREQPTESEMRDFLRARLPEGWIPSRIEALPIMPRLHNGKIDRKALPIAALLTSDPRGASSSDAADSRRTPPRTPTEETLAAIFAEVLEVPEVGVFDNFFDLGGHSLRATRVLVRVQEAYGGIELGLRRFFEEPTVAALARAVEAAQRAPAVIGAAAAPIVRVSREGHRSRRTASADAAAHPADALPIEEQMAVAHEKGR